MGQTDNAAAAEEGTVTEVTPEKTDEVVTETTPDTPEATPPVETPEA